MHQEGMGWMEIRTGKGSKQEEKLFKMEVTWKSVN